MPWSLFIPLLIQYGLPLAEKIFQKVQAGGDVTQADIDELKALGQKTGRTELEAALVRAGIPLSDTRATALLALAPQ